MKKGIIVICIISLLLIVGTIGCFEEEEKNGGNNNNEDPDTPEDNTTNGEDTWTMKEFTENKTVTRDQANLTITLLYDHLDDGESFTIEDSISDEISYNSTGNFTKIVFPIADGNETIICIEGDITDEFTPGTNFTLDLTIKHINVTLDTSDIENVTFIMEIFEEQWISKEHFESITFNPDISMTEAGAVKPMSQSVIQKA